jgi:hypothetical protein
MGNPKFYFPFSTGVFATQEALWPPFILNHIFKAFQFMAETLFLFLLAAS